MPKRPPLRTAALAGAAVAAPLAAATDADAMIDGGPPVKASKPDDTPGAKVGKAKDFSPPARQASAPQANTSPYGDDHRSPVRDTNPTPARKADPVRAEPAVSTPSPVVRRTETPAERYAPKPVRSFGDDHREPRSESKPKAKPTPSYGDDHRSPIRHTDPTPARRADAKPTPRQADAQAERSSRAEPVRADPVQAEPAVASNNTPSPVVTPTETPAQRYAPKPKPSYGDDHRSPRTESGRSRQADPIEQEPAVSSYKPSGSYGDEHRSPIREPKPDTISVYDGPTQGPSIGRNAPPALPFPGANRKVTIGVECSAAPKAGGGSGGGCLGKGDKPAEKPLGNTGAKGSFQFKGEVKGTTARGEDVLTEQGQRTKLSLGIESRVVASGEVNKGRLKAALDYYQGRSTNYEMGVSTDRADEIQRGGEAPDPQDPRTLREGDSILLSKSQFQGGDGKVGYNPVEVGYGRRTGATKSAGVEKGEDGKVQITVGDDDFVESTVTAGIGNEDVKASISGSDKKTDGEATTVELDTTTRRGWNAYQRFVTTGRIPYDPRLSPSHIDRNSSSFETSAGVKVGPIEWAGTREGESTDNRETTNRHGGKSYESSRHLDRLTTTRRQRVNRDGLTRPASTTFLFDDVSTTVYRELSEHLPEGTNAQAVDGDNTDVKLDLSDADLNRLREQAIDRLGHGYKEWGGKTLSRQQVLDMMDEQGTVVAQMETEENLVQAKSPAEIADAIYRKGINGDADTVLKFFTESALADQAYNGGPGEGAGTPTVIDD